ncbi:carbohydrate kinase [Diaminobutyricibacter tongyongensis]|uniref:Carbohydrate kinase n=1 Tax=Leifsonia tongyongensis TaxID=1268043 RepID=A0A6L9XW31_9MICO|nr:carbohydrate kinase [Diaminobutyricibacter tongyongensis]NEN05641.1 carbohydrate kinase [Diaminobutyricibacter tongyongensis]
MTGAHAIVIGEALVDVIRDAAGGIRRHAGGSPMNVAVGLGRLGIDTTLVTQLGDDDNGRMIVEHLRDSAVTIEDGSITVDPTSTATANLDASGAATYDFDLRWGIEVPVVGGADLIHTGSIGSILEPGAESVRSVFASADPSVLLSFDPNIRPAIMGDHDEVTRLVEDLAARCHVVKMSDEDAAWLYPQRSLDDIADQYIAGGTTLFAVTRGRDGCLIRTDAVEVVLPAPAVAVVDTVGAGDAFMSGLLYAILGSGLTGSVLTGRLDRAGVEHVAGIALRSAAITVARAGANPPRAGELPVEPVRSRD